jgi:hypothetical protein
MTIFFGAGGVDCALFRLDPSLCVADNLGPFMFGFGVGAMTAAGGGEDLRPADFATGILLATFFWFMIASLSYPVFTV